MGERSDGDKDTKGLQEWNNGSEETVLVSRRGRKEWDDRTSKE
jgi:hypothetical protein